MTENEQSISNPHAISGNNTDSSDDVSTKNEAAIRTEKDAECFSCNRKESENK